MGFFKKCFVYFYFKIQDIDPGLKPVTIGKKFCGKFFCNLDNSLTTIINSMSEFPEARLGKLKLSNIEENGIRKLTLAYLLNKRHPAN